MAQAVQFAILGLGAGAAYTLLAQGIVLIYRGSGIVNFAHGAIAMFAAFFCFSEAGAFDPATRKLTGQPLGWTLCRYQGVADGRAEFLGYFPGVPRNPR